MSVAMLVELPVPAESELAAFDRTAEHYLGIAAILADMPCPRQHQIILASVERIQATEGGVWETRARLEARPFFADLVGEGVGAAEREDDAASGAVVGYWRSQTDPDTHQQGGVLDRCLGVG